MAFLTANVKGFIAARIERSLVRKCVPAERKALTVGES